MLPESYYNSRFSEKAPAFGVRHLQPLTYLLNERNAPVASTWLNDPPRGRCRQHRRERVVTPPKVMEKCGRHVKRNEAEQREAN